MRDALGWLWVLVPVLVLWRLWRGPLTTIGVRTEADCPQAFGYKCGWFAVQGVTTAEVVEALRATGRIGRAVPANWASGLKRARSTFGWEQFISPPVQGWVLVFEAWLESEQALEGLAQLSARLARTVYAFGSHRTVSAATWAIAENGRITRAWGSDDGETLFEVGEPTGDEIALGLDFRRDPPDEDDDEAWLLARDEGTVINLARAWTIDPTALDSQQEKGVGVLARRRR